jgi:hypothetical protein
MQPCVTSGGTPAAVVPIASANGGNGKLDLAKPLAVYCTASTVKKRRSLKEETLDKDSEDGQPGSSRRLGEAGTTTHGLFHIVSRGSASQQPRLAAAAPRRAFPRQDDLAALATPT